MVMMRRYYDLMEELAREHTEVQHTDDERHYFRRELEEFYMGLRNKVHFPAIIAEGYETSYQNEIHHKETSFIVVQGYAERDDYSAIEEAFETCEVIGEDFLSRLVQGEATPVCLSITPLGAAQMINETEKYVGVRFTIDIAFIRYPSINKQKWFDL
jgi:hypothetical protein